MAKFRVRGAETAGVTGEAHFTVLRAKKGDIEKGFSGPQYLQHTSNPDGAPGLHRALRLFGGD